MKTITNRYQINDKLGAGGIGDVFLAADRLNRQQVALKQVRISLEKLSWLSKSGVDQTIDELRLALAQEFQILAGLRHPYIISVLDYGFDAEQMPFYTMEYLPEAQTILEAAADLDVTGKMDLVQQVLQALTYLHRRQVLHRDLKPNNILFSGHCIRLVNFGLSSYSEQNVTSDGTMLYMAPETLDRQKYIEATDLYSLGVILYQMLANQHPFDEKSDDFVNQVLNNAPDLSKLGVDEQLATFVGRLLSKQPADRYANAGDCLEAFNMALRQPVRAESQAIRESYLQAATFIGREAELTQLQNALAVAKKGSGSAWLIGGESGVGKSRLINELRTQALVSGFQVWRGQAIAEGGSPFQIWHNLANHLALQTDLSDLEAGVLKEIAPNLPQILQRPIPDAPRLDSSGRQQRLIFTMVSLLQRQASPILLLLEDLHWAYDSLALLKELIPIIDKQPMLIIGTFRSDERPSLPQDVGEDVPMLQLSRLDIEHTGQLTQAILGDVGSQLEIVAQLHQETEGNIFFLVEILRAWAEESGGLSHVDKTPLPQHLLTSGIVQIIRRRLEKISDNYQPLLKLAAIAGRQLDLEVLAQLDPTMPLSEWLLACNEAMVLEVQENEWRFAHDKLREMLRQDLTDDEKRQGHEQVALALEAIYGEENEDLAVALADHWRQAGNSDKEIAYAVPASRQLSWSGNYAEVERIISQLFVDYGATIEVTVKLQLLLTLGENYRASESHSKALASLHEGLTLARQVQSEPMILEFLIGLGRALWRQVDHGLIRHGQDSQGKSQLGEAQIYLQEAALLAETLGNLSAQAHSIHNQAMIAYRQDNNLEQRLQLNRQSLAVFKQSDDAVGLIMSISDLASCLTMLGNFAEAKQLVQDGLKETRRIGHSEHTPFFLSSLLPIALTQNDWPLFETHLPEYLKFAAKPQSIFYHDGNFYTALQAFYHQQYNLALSSSGESVVDISRNAPEFYLLWQVYGSAALMIDDQGRLLASLLQSSALHPATLAPQIQRCLCLLYAGKSLFDKRVEQGAAWLGLYQSMTINPLELDDLHIHRTVLFGRIKKKFTAELAQPEAEAAMQSGTQVQLEDILASWPEDGVRDEIGLMDVLQLVTKYEP